MKQGDLCCVWRNKEGSGDDLRTSEHLSKEGEIETK